MKQPWVYMCSPSQLKVGEDCYLSRAQAVANMILTNTCWVFAVYKALFLVIHILVTIVSKYCHYPHFRNKVTER